MRKTLVVREHAVGTGGWRGPDADARVSGGCASSPRCVCELSESLPRCIDETEPVSS